MRSVFLALSMLGLTASAAAQTPSPAPPDTVWVVPPSEKDPGLATALGFLLPGAGHFYAGETETGIVLLGLSVGAPLAGVYYTLVTCESDGFIGCSPDVSLTPFLIGVGVSIGAQIYSIADAGKAARRANTRYALAIAPTAVPSQAGPRPGLALTARF